MCIKKIAATLKPKRDRGVPPPLPRAGGQSIMVDSHSECSNTSQIKKVNLIHYERGQSGIGWHGWHGMEWHGMT